jgi:hypothetical protein
VHRFPAFLLVAVLSGQPAALRAVDVVVRYDPPNLSVQATRPTSLRAVIEEVCRVAQARCQVDEEGLRALGSETVPAMVLHGKWAEIIFQLLSGTDVNYAIFEPDNGQSGRLWVEYRPPLRTPAGDETRPGGNNHSSSSPRTPSPGINSASMPAVGAGDPGNPRSAVSGGGNDSLESSEPISSSGPEVPGAGAGGEVTKPEAVSFMDRPPTTPPNPLLSPFPDSNGDPVPASDHPIQGSPFPDSLSHAPTPPPGNGQPQGSPFPP